ncbi:MAG TPA: hypothetical protein VFR86_26205 [Burkholderiaceae bacterium]|nr:hypothetical protein [Burkholderiaceae bacterium]
MADERQRVGRDFGAHCLDRLGAGAEWRQHDQDCEGPREPPAAAAATVETGFDQGPLHESSFGEASLRA